MAGIDVTVRAEEAFDHQTLRYENSKTNERGQFQFASWTSPQELVDAVAFKGYSLTANRRFISVAEMHAASPLETWRESDGSDDVSWDVMGDPVFNLKVDHFGRPEPHVNDTRYFPMAVQFGHHCEQSWSANCVEGQRPQHLLLPLIPVLNDPAQCGPIANTTLREDCRQLNTYRAAFLHVETIAQLHADRALCAQVNGGYAAKQCLDTLAGYVTNIGLYQGRQPIHMEIPPAEEALILKPMADLVVHEFKLLSQNPFFEDAHYVAYYGGTAYPHMHSVCVFVSLESEDNARRYGKDVMLNGERKPSRIEVIDGNTVLHLSTPQDYVAQWRSGNKIINVHVSQLDSDHYILQKYRINVEASPAARDELVRAYLKKYPSSL